jgi:hypothetical protein
MPLAGFLPTADIFSILAVSGAFDFDYAELCVQSLASKMQGIVSRLKFWRSGLAKDPDLHLRELHTIDSREGFSQNLIEHERSGIGPAETRIAHKHQPHPGLVARERPHELAAGLARKVTIVELVTVTRIDDFRSSRNVTGGTARP